MTAFFRVAFIVLFNDKKLLKSHKAVAAKRTNQSFASRRRVQRRARTAPVAHSNTLRRRDHTLFCRHSLQRASERYLALQTMAKEDEIRRRSSVVERGPLELPEPVPPVPTSTTTALAANPARSSYVLGEPAMMIRSENDPLAETAALDVSPTTPSDEDLTRPSRSTSSSSRTANRLSLTLPIALPTNEPARPTPTSSVASSYPSTPIDALSMASPVDANEFIIAIAAQERRVLELREELGRAEAELAGLKAQFTVHEAHKKRTERRNVELRPMISQPDVPTPNKYEDDVATRRSIELDRRKQILQSQSTPRESRRRVIRGGHTRTLSLLSPTKTDDESGVAADHDLLKSPDIDYTSVRTPNPIPSKRASWQPRAYNPGNTGMTQIVEDLKLGFRTFCDDIRQITVGDEPINGSRSGTTDSGLRRSQSYADEQETIRPVNSGRPRVSSAFDSPAPVDTPSRSRVPNSAHPRGNSKTGIPNRKHFSWTPLAFDAAIDDKDWANWEDSPSSSKPSRWSGSTIDGSEDISSIPKREAGVETPLTTKSPPLELRSAAAFTPQKLEELLPHVVNRLSPRNLKRTASELMTQWEKSLTEPPMSSSTTPSDDKENIETIVT